MTQSWNRQITWSAAIVLLFAAQTFGGVDGEVSPSQEVPAPAAQIVDPAKVTIETIHNAWKRREELTRSAVFEWTEQRRVSESLLAEGEWMAEPFEPEYGVRSRLSFDHNLLKYTFHKSSWNESAPEGGADYVGVYDGNDSKVYLPPGYVDSYPRGHVSSQQVSEEMTSSYLKPFLWAFRGSAPRVLLFSLELARIQPDAIEINGQKCLTLEYSGSPEQKSEICVDPQQDYAIVQYTVRNDGQVQFKFDITNKYDAAHKIWVPDTWQFQTQTRSGKPQLTVLGKLGDFQINPALPASEFEFEFPAGTWVHDGASSQYLVADDGTKRPIARSERNAPYTDLLRGPGVTKTAKHWLLGFNMILVLGLTAFLAVRWHHWKRSMAN